MTIFEYVDDDATRRNFEALERLLGAQAALYKGSGNPNGVVVGSPPDLYLNRSGGGGLTLWVKESGAATNTGWRAV